MRISALAGRRRHDLAAEPLVLIMFGPHGTPSLPSGLTLSEELIGRTAILALDGEFDLYTAPEVDRALDLILRRAPRRLVVDLSQVSFLNSAGLEVLLACHRRAAPRTDLRIVATTRSTWRPLQIARLHETLVIHTSRAAAVAAPVSRDPRAWLP
ncbi:anti-sigma B factor antagonist [Amycolatopsis lexingtonensis]|uniref:Anti-sigma factor antagonist n=1 Tax=Amycolatopsis lexingtonensis TaxID=218822 RepID=A0ABR9HYX8_9PSEU|nr:STAS domain-containing protein [Amycolatopsis lexingtonensis]MBE1496142.1 anti-sigma B factor antagonist [Amycolatopsis lexingtonensis]